MLLHTSPQRFIEQLLGCQIQPANDTLLKPVLELEEQSRQVLEENVLGSDEKSVQEGKIIKTIVEQMPDGGIIFSANSMSIRDLDTFIYQNTHINPKQKLTQSSIQVYANRGCSGIDGNVSTFLGMVASSDKKQTNLAILGDLTTLHDSNGFLMAKALAAQGYSATLVVLNNHGGAIFNYLPQKDLDCFEKTWITDPQINFCHLAKLYGLQYQQVDNQSNFTNSLTSALQYPGISLIEVLIDQKQSVAQHARLKTIIQAKLNNSPSGEI